MRKQQGKDESVFELFFMYFFLCFLCIKPLKSEAIHETGLYIYVHIYIYIKLSYAFILIGSHL